MPSLSPLAAIPLALLLSGCATQYQSVGFTGGHRELAGPGKLQQIQFLGNGFITADKVQRFALYRCAEVARQQGKPHFLIYDSLRAAASEVPSQLPRVGVIGNKPTAAAFMLVLDQPRAGSQATQAVLDSLEPLVKSQPQSPQ